MIRPSSAAWVVLAAGLCTGLFLVKQQVRGLEARLGQLNESILDDQQAIHVLRAEWSYLNQPARLEDLGRRLLSLEAIDPEQTASIADIPLRPLSKNTPHSPVEYSPAAGQVPPILATHRRAR